MSNKCVIEEIVPRQQKGVERLQVYLAAKKFTLKGQDKPVTLNKTSIVKLITQGQISINDKVVQEKNAKIRANDRILITLPTSTTSTTSSSNNSESGQQSTTTTVIGKEINLVATKIDLNILFEDEYIVVINKPAGMIVHPPPPSPNHPLNEENQTRTLVNALLYRYGAKGLSIVGGVDRPGIVHRLDKDTAGILIVAKNDSVHEMVKKMLQDHTSTTIKGSMSAKANNNNNKPTTIQKTYYCLVTGKPKESHGIINKAISRHPMDRNKMVIDESKGKESITEYKVIKSWDKIDLEIIKPKKSNEAKDYDNSEYDIISKKINNNKKKPTNNNKNQNNSKFIIDSDSDENEDDSEEEDESEEEEEEVPVKSTKKQQPKSKFIIIDSDEDEDEDEDEDDDDDEEEESEEDDSDNSDDSDDSDEETKYVGKKIGARNYTLMEITLHTGRQHQIRVHMTSEGLPIVGDPIYSGKSNQFMVPYLLLASVALRFQHPITKQQMEFTIPNPPHLQSFIDQLDKEQLKQYPNIQKNNNINSFVNNNNNNDNGQKSTPTITKQQLTKKEEEELALDMEFLGIVLLLLADITLKTNNNNKHHSATSTTYSQYASSPTTTTTTATPVTSHLLVIHHHPSSSVYFNFLIF
ncbi:hypothetical protein DFA_05554 [Cavenderia fasciculata]|uniref:Pseudouridine synthase RsuA/RluA-like domain-containing protein n=1 Tax=Cavenderia fasciculata TaxID=261658 RepID=F4PLK0_CACFS|nr:uncharacterized protein DFA_05554 [Cavenderia fasciculata]EGG23422.1 hypothetical protein DFA_05554 [Cavenderia fasciculata]|eukprot:XP_004361273.1 hypothetical protein DFA_05554 [Cavenderia fasciculata]